MRAPLSPLLTISSLPFVCLQLDLENGSLLDSHTVRGEYVELARNQGVHLRGHLLLVLGVSCAGCWVHPTGPAVGMKVVPF